MGVPAYSQARLRFCCAAWSEYCLLSDGAETEDPPRLRHSLLNHWSSIRSTSLLVVTLAKAASWQGKASSLEITKIETPALNRVMPKPRRMLKALLTYII